MKVLLSLVLLLSQPSYATDLACGFTKGIEGPTTDISGAIYAVNLERSGTIGKILPSGVVELWATLPTGSIGNGLRILNDEELLVADYKMHQVIHINLKTKKAHVVFRDNRMSQPNDLAVTKDGKIFLSDPDWSRNKGKVWLAGAGRSPQIASDNMGTTNGIELSTDEKFLYVNESTQRKVWRFKVAADGKLSEKTLLHTFSEGEPDGMKVGPGGSLFIALNTVGKIARLNENGKLHSIIQTNGINPSNLTFVPGEKNRIYVTQQENGCVEALDF
jgi:gluconolactonase